MDQQLKDVLRDVRTACRQLLTAVASPLNATLPEGRGVYAISASTVDEAIYVGQTSNFQDRLGTHRRGRPDKDQMNKNLARLPGFKQRESRQRLLGRCSIWWVIVDDPALRLAVESVLVTLLGPPLNEKVHLPQMKRSAELKRRASILAD